MQGPWRLVLRNDLAGGEEPASELYHLAEDPGQNTPIGGKHPEVAARLRRAYDAWWDDLAGGFDRPAEIVVGDDRQDPTELTCFEWHSSRQWLQSAISRGFDGNGYWAIRVARPGRYEITLRRWPVEVDAPITASVGGGRAIAADEARLRVGAFDERRPVTREARTVVFTASLPASSTRLETWFTAADGQSRGAYYVTVRRVDPR